MIKMRRRTRRRSSTALVPAKPVTTSCLPAERYLFSHPSWLHDDRKGGYRWFDNALANPDLAKLVTHVFCLFVETESGADSVKHYKRMKAGCEEVGWTFIPGLRFAHTSKAEWEFLKKRYNHERIIRATKDWPSLCLDLEPYGVRGTRYHSGGDAYELHEASEPWMEFGKPLYVYPPMFTAPQSILLKYHGIGFPTALDHSTYDAGRFGGDLKKEMALRDDYFMSRWSTYCPGFYLRYINDRKVMALAAKYEQCWFYPSSKGDDRKNFMTSDWNPDAT